MAFPGTAKLWPRAGSPGEGRALRRPQRFGFPALSHSPRAPARLPTRSQVTGQGHSRRQRHQPGHARACSWQSHHRGECSSLPFQRLPGHAHSPCALRLEGLPPLLSSPSPPGLEGLTPQTLWGDTRWRVSWLQLAAPLGMCRRRALGRGTLSPPGRERGWGNWVAVTEPHSWSLHPGLWSRECHGA